MDFGDMGCAKSSATFRYHPIDADDLIGGQWEIVSVSISFQGGRYSIDLRYRGRLDLFLASQGISNLLSV
jgi:hypothetical protein